MVSFILAASLIGMVVYKEAIDKAQLSLSNSSNYEFYFRIFQAFFFLAIAYVIFSWFFKKLREFRLLKNQRMEAELASLKNKIDPHFFFNTLNNLYSLAIKKSDDTPLMIQKLSEIMRYTIYEGDNKFVDLAQEISYLEQYIEIHKIRYKKSVSIDFKVNIIDPNLKVAPLLFIMLLENAFKHGVESLTNNAFIKISITADKGSITFCIENNFSPKKNAKKGIGLENLKQRLSLIYSNRHELLHFAKDGIYTAKLFIKVK